ncbi:hypothetical protein H5410_055624 [Solanum commersonii]|uniref:CYRIA/CYRIB Rac1 binding domain-containing protein n=1 Tax=Solanum commersonii TaxID=4109 RepID=A0A9J5WIU6_SOLCO|nr:hypothetical protein H5410_055624 [Solanum commersonii]
MAVPIEEAIAALSTFSLEDDQPEVQGQGFGFQLKVVQLLVQSYSDVAAYRLSLSEDTKAINQLNTLIQEGKEMGSVLYTYRSCVKALPQLPDSMKQSQADLYLETYQVLDLEMSSLREIQRWQASAASKLAADMQRFSRPERRINGPTVTHLWSMLKLLDVLIQLDHLKNAKASIPNDFSWYKRTFTQVSVQWQDTDSMREELDDLQIFLSTRWAILLNLHVEMFRVNNLEYVDDPIAVRDILESVQEYFRWCFTGVYGLHTNPQREKLWDELAVMRGLWNDQWVIGGNKTHNHLVKWKAITQPKSQGGLGIKDLTTNNESMLMKWLMDVLTGEDQTLWKKDVCRLTTNFCSLQIFFVEMSFTLVVIVEDILQVLIVFIVESLELNFALLFPERHTLLRVLPVLVVLAASSEKDSESLYKRVKINRLINIFKNDPVVPAFPDLHLSPAAILKELSTYFPKFSAQTRLLTLPAPHELPLQNFQGITLSNFLTPFTYQRQYLIVNHIGAIRAEHDDFTVRFASAMSQHVKTSLSLVLTISKYAKMSFNLVVNMPRGKLKLKSCQKRKETFFLKWTKKESKTNKLLKKLNRIDFKSLYNSIPYFLATIPKL